MKIDRRSNLSKAEFEEEYLNPLKPVIVEDVALEWPAYNKWSLPYFTKKFKEKVVLVNGDCITMGEFLARVAASSEVSPSHYLTGTSIPRFFPELLGDIDTNLKYAGGSYLCNPFLVERLGKVIDITEDYGLLELLICGKGGVFPNLHYDAYHLHAFVVQVCGEKEFTIYPPNQTSYLYPNPRQPNNSLMGDMRKVDPIRFPLFKHAEPEVVVVKPGGLIFVPSGWWHTTRMLSHSIAVTANCLSDSNYDAFFDDAVTGGYLKPHEKSALVELEECYF
ncbi:Cupin-like domain-containing protein [Alteromonadaceae bacterium 2753L.S.0a.02]|nr:Cupin-like domain-containing protein [Alteromonadaceae bacterium 2753L.S.0a.02]